MHAMNLLLVLAQVLHLSFAPTGVMNPGEAKGQLVYLTERDVLDETPKYKALSPLSIPVFAELPLDLAVVSGAITLKQQNLLSHVQLKSRARGTPNLDLSDQPGGFEAEVLKPFHDGEWVRLLLGSNGSVLLEKSTEAEAIEFYERRKVPETHLSADLAEARIRGASDLSWKDSISVGSKAANYAELARALNTPERTVVRPNYGVPFRYYSEFLAANPAIQKTIARTLKDPLMSKVADVSYRAAKLKAIQDQILSETNAVDAKLVSYLVDLFDSIPSPDGKKRKMKIRSSTNSEDLPNFNGAGLYESAGYKPYAGGVELTREKKEAAVRKALRTVWASVWGLRAYEERTAFGIPHSEVMMGLQVNPSFTDEGVNGVVVTRNVSERSDIPGAGVYIESQRGDKYSVTNPDGGAKPERMLVLYDPTCPQDASKYVVHVLQKSNVSDDGQTVLTEDNPKQVLVEPHLSDLVRQTLKATAHFKPIYGPSKPDFALDFEYKVDSFDTGRDQVYLKQARPYVD
jgi:hypothetical protein